MNMCVSIPVRFTELGMKVISMVLTHSLSYPQPGILPAGLGIFPQQLNTNRREQMKNGDTAYLGSFKFLEVTLNFLSFWVISGGENEIHIDSDISLSLDGIDTGMQETSTHQEYDYDFKHLALDFFQLAGFVGFPQ